MAPQLPESFFTGSSKEATVRRRMADVEELVPKGLALGGLAGLGFPVVAELDGAVLDFVPGEGHGGRA